MSAERLAELDEAQAKLVGIYPELADMDDDYIPSEGDHWSVRMLAEVLAERAEITAVNLYDAAADAVSVLAGLSAAVADERHPVYVFTDGADRRVL